jgi:c-di-GMP-binding flagellar brake protein YcgR
MPIPEIQITVKATRLELWEKLVLQTARDDREYTFLTRVVDQMNEELIVEYPTATEGGGELMVGDPVSASITRPDAVWAFKTKVLAKIQDRPPRMVLAAPKNLQRIQRRRFVRVDCFCPCKWIAVYQPDQGKDGEALGDMAEGTIYNISAGGVLMAADEPPATGSYLILRPRAKDWPLPGWMPGRVAWRRPQQEEGKYEVEIGVDFREFDDMTKGWPESHLKKLPDDILNISQLVRQRLMQFVYQRQIELRKKGLL